MAVALLAFGREDHQEKKDDTDDGECYDIRRNVPQRDATKFRIRSVEVVVARCYPEDFVQDQILKRTTMNKLVSFLDICVSEISK